MLQESPTQRDELQEVALRTIEETHLAGRDTRHNRAANLQAIRGLVRGEPHYTFGIKGVERFTFGEVLDAVASMTKCSHDPQVTTGGGYISPRSTLKGLEQAAKHIYRVAQQGGTFLVATGHPGSLLLYYIELVEHIRRWGGRVLEPQRGALVPPNLDLDYIRGVAVTTDRCSLMHTHDSRAMELMLAGTVNVDLAVVDHGYAGAAINAGVPVVAPMDTNDPALAVAQRLGADVNIIPMDDNRPLSCYLPIVDLIVQFAESEAAPNRPTRSPSTVQPSPEATSAPPEETAANLAQNERDQLRVAQRLVAERVGPDAALDELVLSLLDGYHDQFVQSHFAPDEVVRAEPHPNLDLVIYKRLHDALRWAAVQRMELTHTALTPEEIVAYLEGGLGQAKQ